MDRRSFFRFGAALPVVFVPSALAKGAEEGGPMLKALEAANLGPPPVYSSIAASAGGNRMSVQWQTWFTKLYNAMRTGVPSPTPMENGWRNE